MSFVPDLATLTAFTAAVVILVMTPGPDMTLFISRALAQGRSAGLVSVLGTSSGSVVHTLLVAFGLSALLKASAEAFFVLKIVGALYLLWLAIQSLRHGSALSVTARPDAPKAPMGRIYLTGLLVNLLNPKMVLFFLTFLPQFVAANDPHAAGKLVFLGLYLVILSLPFCVVMVLMAEGFSKSLRRAPKVMRALDWLFAGIIGSFAVKILLTNRS